MYQAHAVFLFQSAYYGLQVWTLIYKRKDVWNILGSKNAKVHVCKLVLVKFHHIMYAIDTHGEQESAKIKLLKS